ncbi:MAG: 4Fe-4S dicluster domain-containing protein [Ruminococcaceae bacterium]|nr:4Fe-4S dicluster domain-containing protein [Oscillospiraceae bacterium]
MPMKNLGFGLMRLPVTKKTVRNEKIDKEKSAAMVKAYLDKGFNYFDTAYMYHGGKSESAAGELICSQYERGSFMLASKMPVGMLVTRGDTGRVFRHQLKRCQTEYFDYYLLHCLTGKNYKKAEKLGVFDYLQKKKAEGKIKVLGFSFHDTAEALDEILTAHPEMEFVQLQINYLDWLDAKVQSKLCYEVARKHGKDIIVMEPVKGGQLAKLPEKAEKKLRALNPEASPASYAIRFAASLEGVFLVLSGMSDMQQLTDNMSFMGDAFVPVSEEEKKVLFEIAEELNDARLIPCTACNYCTEACPKKLPVADAFALYNRSIKGDRKTKKEYAALEEASKLSECLTCGKCEKACPQKIEIIKKLKTVKDRFD